MSHLYDPSPLGKGFSGDLFGRLKVSDPTTLFDTRNRYKLSDDFSAVSVNGTVTNEANISAAVLNITTNSGDKVYYETKRVFPYQPGKSLQVLQTFVMDEPKSNLRQRAGYFSTENGVFLEQESLGEPTLVLRSKSTGEVLENRIPQSTWNVDKLDGTGPSGFTLDLTKAQIFFTEYEWLGVGSVRTGFAIDGIFVIAHQFNHANRIDKTYMTTATLPIRYEIENIGITDSNSQMLQICATVISNGGYERKTETWSATRTTGIASVAASSGWAPVVSLRMKSGRTDGVIVPADLSITAGGNNAVYEYALIRNATITGGSWLTHIPSGGNTEYNANCTSMTGGITVQSGLFSSTTQSQGGVIELGDFRWDLQLGRTQAGVSDTITLAIRHLSVGGTAFGTLGWRDLV